MLGGTWPGFGAPGVEVSGGIETSGAVCSREDRGVEIVPPCRPVGIGSWEIVRGFVWVGTPSEDLSSSVELREVSVVSTPIKFVGPISKIAFFCTCIKAFAFCPVTTKSSWFIGAFKIDDEELSKKPKIETKSTGKYSAIASFFVDLKANLNFKILETSAVFFTEKDNSFDKNSRNSTE